MCIHSISTLIYQFPNYIIEYLIVSFIFVYFLPQKIILFDPKKYFYVLKKIDWWVWDEDLFI